MLEGELSRFNRWWTTSSVPPEFLPQLARDALDEVKRSIEWRQATLLYGLRRVGKTTLMYQTIDSLLRSGVSPLNILYFSFDELAFDVKDVLEDYQKHVLNSTFESFKGRVYVFFDEIQKVRDWENKVKVYYDLYPRVKFFLSGSASITLSKRLRESMAGRVISFRIPPLSFREFLKLNDLNPADAAKNPGIWGRQIIPLFYRYLKFGSFPELARIQDESFARRYIIEAVVERIIYKDIPAEFGVRDVELLRELMYIVANNPGQLVKFSELSKNLGRDIRTISSYFQYLEYGLIVKFLFNYRGSPVASMRKNRKVYPATPNVSFAYNPDVAGMLPKLLENTVVASVDANYFFRNSFEVDIVVDDGAATTAIEIKKGGDEEKQLTKFQRRVGKRKFSGIVVSLEDESSGKFPTIPAWKFLLSPETFLDKKKERS